jgi:pimeloyl-ACP methyl ester carboxylesterase
VRIEHAFVGAGDGLLMVFLHEGLGSLAMWKDFPERLCQATACRGLVFSRPGYGRSTPRAPDETWGVDFMHRQAFEVLPALLRELNIGEPYALFGHSDGGSIALLHAARFADQVRAVIALAPHWFVEDLALASIAQARIAYEQGELKKGLARYHGDPDSAFWGWNRIWLDPAFRRFNISAAVKALRCPLLAVQGLGDEYGTLEQIRGIQRLAPHTQLLELPACGHSPHRDQPEALITATTAFIQTHGDHR